MVARHFLCCLPLRLGALLISFCQLVLGGLIAAGGWYAITALRTSQILLPLRSILTLAFLFEQAVVSQRI
jgi:hypothetical protein